jgi:hypothetical protein
MDTNRGLQYKLRMMGVPFSGATVMFSDNLYMITNTSLPESMLKKKSNYICYHAVCESAAMGEIMTAWESTMMKPADVRRHTSQR